MIYVKMDSTGHTTGWIKSRRPVLPCISNKLLTDGEYDNYGLRLKTTVQKVQAYSDPVLTEFKRFYLAPANDKKVWIITQDKIIPWSSHNHGCYGSAQGGVVAHRPANTDFVIYEMPEGCALVSMDVIYKNNNWLLEKIPIGDVEDWETWDVIKQYNQSPYALRTKRKS